MELCDEYLGEDESEGFRYICCRNSQRAAEIATNTVKQYLDKDSRIKKVVFNVLKDEDLKIYNGLL